MIFRAFSLVVLCGIVSRMPSSPRRVKTRAHDTATDMKTTVSIPDDLFEKVKRLARRAKRSRSEVFSAALQEYVARHAPDEVTEAIDRACEEIADQTDEFVSAASRRVLDVISIDKSLLFD